MSQRRPADEAGESRWSAPACPTDGASYREGARLWESRTAFAEISNMLSLFDSGRS